MATRMDRHHKDEESKETIKRERHYKTQNQQKNNIEEPKKKRRKIWYILAGILLVILLFLGKVFSDAKQTVSNMQETAENSEVSLKEANKQVKQGKPIAILLLGTDDGALNRADSGGLTDTMMVMTLNPEKKEGIMMSIERDTYVTIANQGVKAKLNSAYSYGIGTSIQTVEQLLDIPIDFYATLNMQGLQDLVDAVGGVTVESNMAFTYEGYSFVKGENTLETGKEALAFSRMRKQDPEGDYGRQRRQREIVNAIMKKMASVTSLAHYREILNTVQDNMKTDMNWTTMMRLATKYNSCFDNIQSDYLKGEGFMQDGISYQDVSGDLPRVQEKLKASLAE